MESNNESKLSLPNVFKANAVLNILFGVMMLLSGKTLLEQFGMEVTADLLNMCVWLSSMMIIFGIVSWKMPDWAGDNLSNVGMFWAGFMCIWFAISVYEVASGKFTLEQNAMNFILNPLFAGLFYWKSKE